MGARIDEKSQKIDVKKAFVLKHVFFFDFLRFCMDLGPSKPQFLDQIWLQNEKRRFCKNCAPVQAGALKSRIRGVQNQQKIKEKSMQK